MAMDRMVGNSDVPHGTETGGTSGDIVENYLPIYLKPNTFCK